MLIIAMLTTLTGTAPPMVLVDETVEGAPSGPFRKLAEVFGDAVLLLLMVALLPIAVLVVGTPIALLARILIEFVNRL